MDDVHTYERATGTAVKSAERVLDALELMAVVRNPMGVSELARRLNMPKSSAHMLLATLETRGYVISDPQRRFSLNPLMGGGNRTWVGGFQGQLLRVARPLMEELVQSTGESALLGRIRDGMTLEYFEKVVTKEPLRVDVDLSVPRALHSTSTGQVLLAYAPPAVVAAFMDAAQENLGSKGIATLKQTLAQVLARGFAMVSDPNSAYAFGAAAPIRDGSGEVIAGLNVAAPAARFHAARDHVIRELVRVAATISHRLAHYPEVREPSLGPHEPVDSSLAVVAP